MTHLTMQVEWQRSGSEASIRNGVSELLLDSSDWLDKEPLKNLTSTKT